MFVIHLNTAASLVALACMYSKATKLDQTLNPPPQKLSKNTPVAHIPTHHVTFFPTAQVIRPNATMSGLSDELLTHTIQQISVMMDQVDCCEEDFVHAVTQFHSWLNQITRLYEDQLEDDDDSDEYLLSILARVKEARIMVVTWANEHEKLYLEDLCALYPDSEPFTNTNLGRIDFATHITMNQQHAIKYSRVYHRDGTENPGKEAVFLGFGTKDLHSRMLRLYHAKSLPHARLFVTITPRMPGDLSGLMSNGPAFFWHSPKWTKLFLAQLFYSLDYFHNHLGVAHMDIKPKNIFVDRDNLPVYGDFGAAKIAEWRLNKQNSEHPHFWQQYFFAAVQKHALKTMRFDQAHVDALPRFQVRYAEYKRNRLELLSETPQPHHNIPAQPNGSFHDICRHVCELSVGRCHGVASHLGVDSVKHILPVHTENSIAQHKRKGVQTDDCEEHLISLLSPHTTHSPKLIYTTLRDYHALGITLPLETSQLLLQCNAFTFRFSYDEWCRLDLASFYPDHDLSNKDLPTPRDYRLPTKQEYVDHMIWVFATWFNFTPDMIDRFVYVEFFADLHPYIYSRLCPDLSEIQHHRHWTRSGTPAYQAPEIVAAQGGEVYDPFKTDIYSLGLIVFAMVFGKFPYSEPDLADPRFFRLHNLSHTAQYVGLGVEAPPPVILDFVRGFPEYDNITPHSTMLRLLDKMLCINPTNRCTIKHIVQDLLDDLVV